MELKDIDLSDLEFWKRPLEARAAAFAGLRARPRLAFFAEPEPPPGMAPGPGYYASPATPTSSRPAGTRSCSAAAKGTNIGDMPPEFLEFFGSMINLDDPRHARFRRIVSRAFTPRFLDHSRPTCHRSPPRSWRGSRRSASATL